MKFSTVFRRALYAGCAAIMVAGTVGAVAGTASASTITAGPTGNAAQETAQPPSKGRPPLVGSTTSVAPNVITTPADGMFQYAQASQFVFADGARGYFTIPKPVVAPHDSHSLAELAVQSSDQRQVIEVGWTVDRGLNGDDDPHLFVFHWIDGVRTCYNACGFVPFNEPGYTAGMKLPVTTTPTQFNILHHGAEWRVGYNGHWVGAFPDSEWSNTFKVAGLVQWFGEVDAPRSNVLHRDGQWSAREFHHGRADRADGLRAGPDHRGVLHPRDQPGRVFGAEHRTRQHALRRRRLVPDGAEHHRRQPTLRGGHHQRRWPGPGHGRAEDRPVVREHRHGDQPDTGGG